MSIRSRNIYNPQEFTPYKLSRSRLELFIDCPRCFYLDRRLGVDRPAGFPFTLNNAVDFLLKKEFDLHRAKNQAHPLMEQYKIDAIPYDHPDLEQWRNNFVGIQYLHKKTNFLVSGAIDDVWVDSEGKLIIVDYKATSTDNEITLEAEYRQGYKRQMEIYQWLFRQNGYEVSETGYFVYANGQRDRQAFDGKLEFTVQVIPYKGSDVWVEGRLQQAADCLRSEIIPKSRLGCPYCSYRQDAYSFENKKS
jgi:hypothetical protein